MKQELEWNLYPFQTEIGQIAGNIPAKVMITQPGVEVIQSHPNFVTECTATNKMLLILWYNDLATLSIVKADFE